MRRRRASLGRLLCAIVVLAAGVLAGVSPARAQPSEDHSVLVFLVDDVNFEDMLTIPETRALATVGGLGLFSPAEGLEAELRGELGATVVDLGSMQDPAGDVSGQAWTAAGDRIQSAVEASGAQRVLVIVASLSPSRNGELAGARVTGVVMADGTLSELSAALASASLAMGPIGTLSSHRTHRLGVVASTDLLPTALVFLGRKVDGCACPLRVMREPPPWNLYERHLANERMAVPVQTAAGIWVTLLGLFGIGVVAFRRRLPQALVRAARWAPISLLPLSASVLAAGHLPTLSYATVAPFIVGVTILATAAVVPLGRRQPFLPAISLAWAVLAFLAVEAALGWTAALTPFLGGSELDGGRFYGLPNVFIGLLLGSGVYAATGLSARNGFLLLLAAALFAGLPWTGANLGGAVTLLAAAGLWLAFRERGRLDARGLGAAAITVAAGTAVVLAANRYLGYTHLTAFVESGGGGRGGLVGTVVDRLGVGLHLIARNPFALIPTLGTPAVLLAALRPAQPVREAFERNPVWRHAVLTISLGSIVAYLVNDSGPSAIGLGFATSLAALVLVTLVGAGGEPA